ncbi:MAG: hypothetical protein ABIS50_15725 [Luteolibacter sp.]|uniref:hypothetical protein n=1 Tax=Luteolibacter sp. TaxID=1962973 RepID=UPI0032668549
MILILAALVSAGWDLVLRSDILVLAHAALISFRALWSWFVRHWFLSVRSGYRWCGSGFGPRASGDEWCVTVISVSVRNLIPLDENLVRFAPVSEKSPINHHGKRGNSQSV